MKTIMFTKHLEGLDVPGIIGALKSVGVEGADLCVRPGYPVHPENVETALPDAAKRFADEGLSIPLVTTPGDFVQAGDGLCGPPVRGLRRIGREPHQTGILALGHAGMDYWEELDAVRGHLEGFQTLSEKHGVQTVVHNHSGLSMGLNSCAAMNAVKGFDPKHIGVFADPGHLSVCGEPIELALNIVRSHLSVVALKDLIRQPLLQNGRTTWRTRVVRLGEGFGDWPALLRAFRAVNFDGPLSFHSEYSGEPVDTVIDLARSDVRFFTALLKEG